MNTDTTVSTREAPWSDRWLDDVLAIEQSAYSHPWTIGNFKDSVASGYQMHVLLEGAGDREQVVGYWVAMEGVDEVHLLNITVTPQRQGLGLGTRMLESLCNWSRQRQAQWLWLEVRASNARALAVYQRFGFKRVGSRKAYYPLAPGQREDAVVMSLLLRSPRVGGTA